MYLEIRPSVSAARNFLGGYCMAPAASRNGTMGTGGSKSGEPPSSEDLATLVHFFTREPAVQRFFPSLCVPVGTRESRRPPNLPPPSNRHKATTVPGATK